MLSLTFAIAILLSATPDTPVGMDLIETSKQYLEDDWTKEVE